MSQMDKLPLPESPRWRLLRAGIQNVWEYDDQRFVFHCGRLLLRGQNESGKTKALEVLLPFLLDGSLSPQRLDPFGSNARAMRWNLINDSNPDVSVSIGYVWIELGRLVEGTPEFWTVGAGLKARRSANSVDDWYFATSKRVDLELRLLDAGRVPLTKAHLVEALAGEGQVFDRASDHRRALNERLFGLSADQYSALVDALLQLRRPQLSKQLDPAELSRILSASLPPLDPAVIGSLAEGFERLDRHRLEREEYFQTLLGVRSFLEVYRGYAGSFLKARANDLTRAESAFHAARAKQREAEEQQASAEEELGSLQKEIDALEREAETLAERLRTLRESDDFRQVAALEEAERQLGRAREGSTKAAGRLETSRQRLERLVEKREKAEEDARRDQEALARDREAALSAAREAVLVEAHGAALAELEAGRRSSAADTLQLALRERKETIASLRRHGRRVAEAIAALDSAMARLSQAEDRVRVAGEHLAEAEGNERRVREAFFDDVREWAARCQELKVDVEPLLGRTPEEMRRALEPSVRARQDALETALNAASLACAEAERTLKALRDERSTLVSAKHHAPPPPAWRTPRAADRPGAPLYLLCEYRTGFEATHRAGLEAALEAAGLLDAWVTPEGVLEDLDRFDLFLVDPLEAAGGATLVEALSPVDGGAVSPERIERALRSIGLAEPGAAEHRTAWVSPDGRFALGPLRGRNGKAEAAFIGEAAREQARLRRLSELDLDITEREGTFGRLNEALEVVRGRRSALDEEVARFPEVGELLALQTRSRTLAEVLEQAREALGEEATRVKRAEFGRLEAVNARDAAAAQADLRGWVERLDELERRTVDYGLLARGLLQTDERAGRSAAELEACRKEAVEEEAELARMATEASEADLEKVRSEAHAEALRESLGGTRDELLAALQEGGARQKTVQRTLKESQEQKAATTGRLGGLRAAAEGAQQAVATCDETREQAEARLRELAVQGLFSILGAEAAGSPLDWSYTDALLAARRVDELTAKLDPSDAARDKAWNKVSEKHQDLMRSLQPEIRVIPEQHAGLMLYRASYNARALSLVELRAELEADVAARDRLLGDEERRLFESFLAGEAHEHLRDQLRSAKALVKRMNAQLEAHPTSSGMKMRLLWELSEDAPSGAQDAVGLLFKSGALLSDSDRTALLAFLRQRLEEARARTEAHTLEEQLLSVLDYRAWHRFQVECRSGAEGWKRLTRRVHAAGSGGQKAVMLHLPLFAAAAAFYDSARPGSPRLILLDEAFAGIDRETRGQLMGLLSEFDLDFVMTSFEEWGFYPQLDGLSTYHLAREKGMPGVFADWFVWNGHEAVQMQP